MPDFCRTQQCIDNWHSNWEIILSFIPILILIFIVYVLVFYSFDFIHRKTGKPKCFDSVFLPMRLKALEEKEQEDND